MEKKNTQRKYCTEEEPASINIESLIALGKDAGWNVCMACMYKGEKVCVLYVWDTTTAGEQMRRRRRRQMKQTT
jgi:hypothetical protein